MAIFLTLKASNRLRGWLVASHAIPSCLVFYHAPLVISLPFFILVLVTGRYAWCQFGLSGRGETISTIAFHGADNWCLIFSSGEQKEVALLRAAGLSHYWKMMVFIDGRGKSYRVFICSDSTDTESFRRLRLLLNLRNEGEF